MRYLQYVQHVRYLQHVQFLRRARCGICPRAFFFSTFLGTKWKHLVKTMATFHRKNPVWHPRIPWDLENAPPILLASQPSGSPSESGHWLRLTPLSVAAGGKGHSLNIGEQGSYKQHSRERPLHLASVKSLAWGSKGSYAPHFRKTQDPWPRPCSQPSPKSNTKRHEFRTPSKSSTNRMKCRHPRLTQ